MNEDRIHEAMRKQTAVAREELRSKVISQRRFGHDFSEDDHFSLDEILANLRPNNFTDSVWLDRLKKLLSTGQVDPEDFFLQSQHLVNLSHALSHSNCKVQLLAVQVTANLSPLSDKNGLQLARASGPYLVTLLSSSSVALKEAAAVALGNIALAGFRVAKVLINQECVQTLSHHVSLQQTDDKVVAALFYALYHIMHVLQEHGAMDHTLTKELVTKVKSTVSSKAPLELFWLLFVLSCDPDLHQQLASDQVLINTLLDTCTYEIFQKSDPRPLVKVVTPIVRTLANLSGGSQSEQVCLSVLRHPDITAILMALLGTNYTHLCRETLWWFANVVNNESVVVQEQLVDVDIMDKLEYHTVQAIQKLDPYAGWQ